MLLQESPGELVDFLEIPTGHVYPIVGLHDVPAANVLQPRDLSNPLYVLNEIIKSVVNTKDMREKYANDAVVHAELVTDDGSVVLFTETGLGQVRAVEADETPSDEEMAEFIRAHNMGVQAEQVSIKRAGVPWGTLLQVLLVLCVAGLVMERLVGR